MSAANDSGADSGADAGDGDGGEGEGVGRMLGEGIKISTEQCQDYIESTMPKTLALL